MLDLKVKLLLPRQNLLFNLFIENIDVVLDPRFLFVYVLQNMELTSGDFELIESTGAPDKVFICG